MDLKERILAFMQEAAYRPLDAEDLAAQMKIKGRELEQFWEVLAELEACAAIIKTRVDKYGLPSRMNLVVGRLEANSKGFGFVVSDDVETDLFIPPTAMLSAMNNDIVVARINNSVSELGKRPEGAIIRVVSRANSQIVGLFESSGSYGFVLPDDKRIGSDIFIARKDFNGAKNGQKVVAMITKWPEARKRAEGKISEVLGNKGDKGIEILSIIKKHNMPVDFPEKVKRAALRVPRKLKPTDYDGRRDMRRRLIVTVDSEDARDLDDAVGVQLQPDGNYCLSVHIADVSHYVRENTVLDQEARERGTSVYLVDRVLPMLPTRLSNGICSLNAGEDRLAMSADMVIDHEGQIVAYDLYESVIRVDTRLSYNIVRGILADEDAGLCEKYWHLVPMLRQMKELCHILRAKRMRRGAIDFDFPEIKVKLDEDGKPVAIEKRVRTISESLVEEFMLAANETVARHMQQKQRPCLYRIHEKPDAEKMAKLNTLLHNFNQTFPLVQDIQPMALQKVLKNIAGAPEERIISTVLLRSLKQARYDAENSGHFGLAAEYYTHFTSPIRRYPDLVVHRMLREEIHEAQGGKTLTPNRRKKLTVLLPEIAQAASASERAAAEAERETVDFKEAEYMADFIGERFTGYISGVTAFGLFVELENGIEGLVHVSTMDDDYYQFVEEQYAMLGERTKHMYRLGDKVEIYVNNVNLAEHTIDFILYVGQQFKQAVAVKKPHEPKPAKPKTRKKAGSEQTAADTKMAARAAKKKRGHTSKRNRGSAAARGRIHRKKSSKPGNGTKHS